MFAFKNDLYEMANFVNDLTHTRDLKKVQSKKTNNLDYMNLHIIKQNDCKKYTILFDGNIS